MSPLTRGWVVAFSGLGINLTLGVLYTWSVTAQALTRPAVEGGRYLWTAQQATWPFAFAVVCFTLTMVLAGRLQDRVGPRWVATAGGAMVGIGMIVASLSPIHLSAATAFPSRMVLGFGVLTGVGLGLAYASATPAAVKWFPTGRRGLITGIVVSGFGLASLYTTPLTAALIGRYGINESFLFLGVVFFVVIVGLAQLIADPPNGYVPPGSYAFELPTVGPPPAHEHTWREMLRQRSFYVLWAMYACAACTLVMVAAILALVAAAQPGGLFATRVSHVLVAALALGYGLGAPAFGLLSDRVGRQHALLAVFTLLAGLVVGVRYATWTPLLVCLVFFIGFGCGAILTLFPATTFDFFGTKNGGVDYGAVFTAWGVGGVFGALAAAWAFDQAGSARHAVGSYPAAFVIAVLLCLAAAGLALMLRPPDTGGEHSPVLEPHAARQA